ncbi:MAG TPA: Hsp70 family protein [Kofleriaceae bacterium]|nr:Hsp70 family protein [Kofleriaceae bacterium]
MSDFVGIDFGTTNSAVGLAARDGQARLAALPGPAGAAASTWRTVLFFELGEAGTRAGAPAIERYLEVEGDGRLVQSLKSHLASASFTRTTILGRTWSLEDLVAEFVDHLRRASGEELGRRAVVGRPVHYWGARDQADDDRAVGRMRAALASAGFDEIAFEYEPVAAASRYAAALDHEELILVADFGGGTSDFSLVWVGPDLVAGDPSTLLGSAGAGIGGDSFDARVIDALVAPALGRGSSYRDELGAVTPVPVWLYAKLRRWHHLSFLKAPDTMRLLERLAHGALEPERIDRLVRVVRDDLGLPLHQAVERTKLSLTAGERGELDAAELSLRAPVARADFEAWIDAELRAIDDLVSGLLAGAGVAPGDVDRVFATGGSSLVPSVRRLLADRFGADRLVGGEELTSVARGLALRARQLLA